MGKVVHISDEIHAKARTYCDEKGLDLKSWVSNLIVKAVSSGQPVPVAKKPQPQTPGDQVSDEPEPWRQPPFWKGDKAS